MEDHFSKIRIYCPEHQIGFEIESGGGIFCPRGKHFLSSEFPPQKSYLEYCCGCLRFIPFAITGDDKKRDCANCEREISRRYFCHKCKTLTNDIKKTSKTKKFEVSDKGEIIPHCPACNNKAKEKALYFHECETLKTRFYTSRETCEFCHISTDPKDNQLVIVKKKNNESENKDDVSDEKEVAGTPNFIIVGRDVAQVKELEDKEEKTVVLGKKPDIPFVEENAPIAEAETNSTKKNKKNNTALVSCMVVLGIFMTLIVLCSYIGNKISQQSNNSSNSLAGINQTSNLASNKSGNSYATPDSTIQVKSSFRDNSRITLDGATLLEEPEYNSYVVTSVLKETKIRVIDRKSSTSPWYKIKTENGDEGWIHGDYIDSIDWTSLPCKVGETGVITGGNLRSSPAHSLNEANVLAIWDPGTKVKILEIHKGEAGAKSGNPYWYKVEVLEGKCSLDKRRSNSETDDCRYQTEGYMNSFLIVCD